MANVIQVTWTASGKTGSVPGLFPLKQGGQALRGFRGGAGKVSLLIVLLIAGAIIGSLIGEALSPVIPFLKQSKDVELGPTRINLVSLSLTLGFAIKLNLAGALGMVAGYLMYRRS